MAKQISYVDEDTGTEHPETYCRVDSILLDYRSQRVTIIYGWYASEKAAVDGKTPYRTDRVERDGDDALDYFTTSDLRPAAYTETNEREGYERAVNV